MEPQDYFSSVGRYYDGGKTVIIVCEPQCKGISHEKVNNGFLYGLLLAYPKEKITFFAETNHYKSVNEIFKHNHISTKKIIHASINFDANKIYSLGGIIRYYLLIKNIFDKAISIGVNKVLFLSTNPIILYAIKRLKKSKKYRDINCTFVLHGELEDIANKNYKEPYAPVIKDRSAITNIRFIFLKLLRNPSLIKPYFFALLFVPWSQLYSRYSLIFKKRFRVKKMMMWRHSNQYKYISLSPHVTKNTSRYLNIKYLNFNTVIMPIIFDKPCMQPKNKHIKFAVFGYGDFAHMHEMLTLLTKKKLHKPYEIRIISMDSRGTEGFPNIIRLSDGKLLSRKEMEDSAKDIDVFINLYDKNRHRFGCSLSIFESFSYLKPVLHLSNPGYNFFNKKNKPVGYRCETLEEFVDRMADMIEEYPKYKQKLSIFRKNILKQRQEYSIKNNLRELRKSFTFTS